MTTLEYIRSNHFRNHINCEHFHGPSDIPEKKANRRGCFRFWPIPPKEGRASRKDVEPSAIAQEMAADIAEGQSAGEVRGDRRPEQTEETVTMSPVYNVTHVRRLHTRVITAPCNSHRTDTGIVPVAVASVRPDAPQGHQARG